MLKGRKRSSASASAISARTSMSGRQDKLADMAHFQIPLDLPHAGRIAERILTLLEAHLEELELDAPDLLDAAEHLSSTLFRFVDEDENPPAREATAARDRAADLARTPV